MNIQTMGQSLIALLVDQQIVRSISDIYTLDTPAMHLTLSSLPGIGDKKIDTMLSELHKSKNTPLWRILHALGIPHIGIKTAKDISKKIQEEKLSDPSPESETISYDQLGEYLMNTERMSSLYGIGETMIEDIPQRWQTEKTQRLLHDLTHHGVIPTIRNSEFIIHNSQL